MIFYYSFSLVNELEEKNLFYFLRFDGKILTIKLNELFF